MSSSVKSSPSKSYGTLKDILSSNRFSDTVRSSDSPAKKTYTALHSDQQKLKVSSRNSSKQSTKRVKTKPDIMPRTSPPRPTEHPSRPQDIPVHNKINKVLKFEKSLSIPELTMDELQQTMTDSRYSTSNRSEGEIEFKYHKVVIENAQLKEKLKEFQDQNLENVKVAETELRKLFLQLKESKASQEKLFKINKDQQKQLEIAVAKISELENTVFNLKNRKTEVSAMNYSIDQSLGFVVDRFRTFSLLKKVFKLLVEACNRQRKITVFQRKMRFKKKYETLKISFAAWKWNLKCEVYLNYRSRDMNKKLLRKVINAWRTAVINEKIAQEKFKIKQEAIVKISFSAWNDYTVYKQRRKLHKYEAREYYQTMQKKKLIFVLRYNKTIRSAKYSAKLWNAYKDRASLHYKSSLLKKSFRTLLNWCYTFPLPTKLKRNFLTPSLDLETNLSPIRQRPLSLASTPVNKDKALDRSIHEMMSSIETELKQRYKNMPYKKE